jgi:small subunit ribosomal protein S16
MPVRLRLQRHGRTKKPFYFIVAADSRSPRDGAYIERVGDYNPLTTPATINIDADKAFDWVMKGAEPSDTVRRIVRKGAFTQEEADTKYAAWVAAKGDRTQDRIAMLNAAKKEAAALRAAAETDKRNSRAAAKAAAAAPAEEAPAVEEADTTAATEITETTESTDTAAAE